jgi:CRISPR-associated protein Csb3
LSQKLDSAIRIRLDPTNPGQFFACCGLLELADRYWGGAEGWFENTGRYFGLRPLLLQARADHTPTPLAVALANCSLVNSMTAPELRRRDELSSMPKKQIEADESLKSEKNALDSLWREAPVLVGEPFNLRIDWFADTRAGGAVYKTWAGQQSVIDLVGGQRRSAEICKWRTTPLEDWLFKRSPGDCPPFYFDSDLGAIGGDRDVGFSVDPLKDLNIQTRPLVELLAFFGLQRFRPFKIKAENRHRFCLWFDPMAPEVAALAACGVLDSMPSTSFEFRLLYRTKYLKSFLPAVPIPRSFTNDRPIEAVR